MDTSKAHYMVALVPEQCELWRSKMDGRRFDGKVEVAVWTIHKISGTNTAYFVSSMVPKRWNCSVMVLWRGGRWAIYKLPIKRLESKETLPNSSKKDCHVRHKGGMFSSNNNSEIPQV
ncbi:predicted protein [Plenodomus lingam JN3]|uniref:Predicted protein n=1 Tax=Leptosphaeria maculans (strain JN3 / isolate v23.1.3 / race Av1-4-5-6-7-8) TaxID=985895 RepID=E4ZIP6_LEPMJ|nr:predicted protein [Plenodomus lingam JN3]CBX91067.1 predicted protein [Plenodomus lingam JN3]